MFFLYNKENYIFGGELFLTAILIFWAYSFIFCTFLSPHKKIFRTLSILAIVNAIVYLCLGGIRIRYFFSSIIVAQLFNIYAFSFQYKLLSPLSNDLPLISRKIKRFISTLAIVFTFIGPVVFMGNFVIYFNSYMDQETINQALQIPSLKRGSGIIAGKVDDPYAGYITAQLKREYANSLNPEMSYTKEDLLAILKSWNVNQILWIGDPPPFFEMLHGIFTENLYKIRDKRIFVLDLINY